jgi:hypothetical protein
MVVTELKFRNVQRHIFGADLVERADNAALEDRPEAFNRIGVHRADDVLLCAMVHGAVCILFQVRIDGVFIGRQQADFFGHHFANELLGALFRYMGQNAGDDVALAAYSADDRRLTRSLSAALMAAVNPMLVGVLAANPRFINLDNAAQLNFRLNKSGADFVAHGMRGPVGAETHHALHLQRADSLFAGQHQMHDAKPLAQRLVRVLKNGASDVREAVARTLDRLTSVALPFESHRPDRENLDVPATRTVDAIRPAARDKIRLAGILIRERRFELSDGHLVNWFRSAGHIGVPCLWEPIWHVLLDQSSPG